MASPTTTAPTTVSGAGRSSRNRSATALKLLVYDGNGFWLCLRRLSCGKLLWWSTTDLPLHPLAAPLRADLAGLPPVIVLLAELDVLRSEGEALVTKLRSSGVPVETETFAGTVHGFLRATGSVQKARDAVAMAGRWMQKATGTA